MDQQSKRQLWVVAFVAMSIILVIGVSIGSFVGYAVASQLLPVSQPVPVQTVSSSVSTGLDLAPVSDSAAPVAEPQIVNVTEESASVDAVSQVLPAVVTVLTQGTRGGGSGSGFVISQEGYVVTNNHVVEGGRSYTVIYSQGGTVPASLVGTAPDFDLAVLKVEGPVPAVAQWGDSSELPLGANVIAIGSALGRYQNTVTAGILSGFNRDLGGLRGLLQTDAAINQGNSGGPLINLGGQIIGVNTLTVRGGFSQAEGLNFAIASNVAQNVVRRLIESGEVKQPFLGIQYQEINPQLASEERLSIMHGALLQDVVLGTPAFRAGLEVGDVILAIDGKPVDDRNPLVSLLLEHVAGDTITLEFLRDGQTLQTTITLAERT